MSTHRDQLESQLLAEYDRRHPQRRRPRARFAPLLAAAVLLFGIGVAARAPADYAVELGQRIEVHLPEGVELPPQEELRPILRGGAEAGGGSREIRVQVERRRGEGTILRIDLWGAPIDGIAARLKARLPSLASAPIVVQPLSGRVRTNVAGLLRERLLHGGANPAQVEEARRELEAELRKQGETGKVNLEVDDSVPGQREIKVKVEESIQK